MPFELLDGITSLLIFDSPNANSAVVLTATCKSLVESVERVLQRHCFPGSIPLSDVDIVRGGNSTSLKETKDKPSFLLRSLFCQSIYCPSLGKDNSRLTWNFNFFRGTDYGGSEINGFFLDKEPISHWHHDTAHMWTEILEIEGEEKRQNVYSMTKELARQLRSGKRVLYTSALHSFLNALLPSQCAYIISSWTAVPELVLQAEDTQAYSSFRNRILGDIMDCTRLNIALDYGIECDLPLHHCGTERKDHFFYYFPQLRMNAVPTQLHTDPARVAYYCTSMEADEEFVPTILLLSPHSMLTPHSWIFCDAGLVLDGHHKLSAAAYLKRPLRILFVEMVPHSGPISFYSTNFKYFEKYPFASRLPWASPSPEFLEKAKRDLLLVYDLMKHY